MTLEGLWISYAFTKSCQSYELLSSEIMCLRVVEMEPSVKPTISTAKQGYAQTLSGWMKDFPGSSEHNAALEKAIQSGPEDLARQKQDIWISDHIDFGLKHAGKTSFSDPRHVYLNCPTPVPLLYA